MSHFGPTLTVLCATPHSNQLLRLFRSLSPFALVIMLPAYPWGTFMSVLPTLPAERMSSCMQHHLNSWRLGATHAGQLMT